MEKNWIEIWKLKISGLSSDPVGASQGSMQVFVSTVRGRLLAPSGIITCIACLYWHVSWQVWYEDTCQCGCARTDSAAKHYCALDANRQWSDETCSCVCKVSRHVDLETGVKHILLQMTCPHATELDPDTCTCGEGVSQWMVMSFYQPDAFERWQGSAAELVLMIKRWTLICVLKARVGSAESILWFESICWRPAAASKVPELRSELQLCHWHLPCWIAEMEWQLVNFYF